MKFYSGMEANHGVWDGRKMIDFIRGVYVATDPKEIELLKSLGYKHDPQPYPSTPKVPDIPDTPKPTMTMNKKQLLAIASGRGVAVSEEMTKSEILDMIELSETSQELEPEEELEPEVEEKTVPEDPEGGE